MIIMAFFSAPMKLNNIDGEQRMTNYKFGFPVLFALFLLLVFSSCSVQYDTAINSVTETEKSNETAEKNLSAATQQVLSETTQTLLSENILSEQPETAVEDVSKLQLSEKSFAASDEYIKPLGRNIFKNDIRMFTYTCSGIEFEFMGTSADIDVICGGKARVAAYVDDVLVIDSILEKGESNLEVFSADTSRNCKITLRKLSETGGNYVGVKNINVVSQGSIAPTVEKERRIEFIGDSITCGYGIDSDNEYDGFIGALENGSKTYAALLSERFDAEYSICAWGGIGVYSSYTEGNIPNRDTLIGNVYDKQGILGKEWDFSQQPDLIIINAGSNDNVWVRGIEDRKNKFGEAYYELIAQVRAANPEAYIICAFGVLNTGLMDEIEKQASLFRKNTGDEKIFCFEFELQNIERDGYGTNYHPSAKTHENMANALAEYISEVIGWEYNI